MAYSFDGTNDYIDLVVAAGITDIPDGDWTMAGWVKFNSLAGSEASYIMSTPGTFSGHGGWNFYVPQNSFADTGARGKLTYTVWDEQIDQAGVTSSTAVFTGNTNWTHIAAVRSGNTTTIYVNGSSVGSFTNSSIDATTPTAAVRFGGNFDLDASEFFNGDLAEWAKWNGALSIAEITALVKFYAPSFFRNSLQWYLPMIRDYIELKSGLVVTNNGTIVAPHPPIIYPSGPYIIQAPVSAGETFEFAGSETVSFDGSVSMVQTATMTGAEEVSFDGTADTIRNQWAFDGSEDVLFDGTAGLQQDAAFTGAESVSFDGSAALKQSAALTGSETVSFDGTAALDIAAIAFEGQGVLSFDGSIATLNLILEMEAAAAVSFDGEAAIGQQALFEGAATLSFDGVAALTGFQWDPVETPASMTWSDVD